ncbi:uncharacterized protein M6B38_123810 [Iris pallida]|uniref:SH2 domain-containing protein n=1 Tax=Iris pallida TaxID=29817 RepID=A0AAX6H211_IRIPA|nr:uncharacterized protein M6B38_123810 [Iris pallida]
MAEEEEYLQLESLRIELDQELLEEGDLGFSLCLWIYLPSSAPSPSVLILQRTQIPSEREEEVPFLALNEENKLSLFPLMFLHKEAPSPDSSFVWTEILNISTEVDCPREKWVHIGCEVARNRMRLHVDGTLVREKTLSVLSNDHDNWENLKKIALVGSDTKSGKYPGYVYDPQVLPISASTKDHFIKNPPVKLTLDGSCISDGVEEGNDGIWSIVGGKASCRRNFSLEVVLLDALGRSVHKEMEIIASLIYADSGTPVDKSRDDAEAPLLTSCDGLEFPSTDRPVTLLLGRATFKLKISQLSSKSDNRLFRVYFQNTSGQKYPFLETYSHPIRCISRNRTCRPSVFGKKPFSTSPQLDETHSPEANNGYRVISDARGSGPFQVSSWSELRSSPLIKRFKVGHDKSSMAFDANEVSEKDEKELKTSLEAISNNFGGTDSGPSDSESTDARNSESRTRIQTITPISDESTFRYCLEGEYERSILLKQMIDSASNEDIVKFAEQVCLYAGCSHHRYQILLAKQLIHSGADAWNSICGSNHSALWTAAVPVINESFMRIAHSTTRGLSGKDLEVLREIAGCGEDLCRDNFEKMWCWLYPVACSLANDQIYGLWECTKPRWIEGFITKEEAENSLRCPRRLQKPGTFVLRFPTSRSWPHPDAGNLVVTYVAADFTLHHKLLSLDLSAAGSERNFKNLQTLLLKEPQLSQVGRQGYSRRLVSIRNRRLIIKKIDTKSCYDLSEPYQGCNLFAGREAGRVMCRFLGNCRRGL